MYSRFSILILIINDSFVSIDFDFALRLTKSSDYYRYIDRLTPIVSYLYSTKVSHCQ